MILELNFLMSRSLQVSTDHGRYESRARSGALDYRNYKYLPTRLIHNLYARKYDAQANGLAMMAPGEFYDMYTRWEDASKMTPKRKEEIFQSSYFHFSRDCF
jgi:hypothetical protein